MTREFFKSLIYETDSCIIWNFGIQTESPKTYPKLWLEGKSQAAHVVSFSIFNGKLLPGEIVRHSCDRTFCINPRHLVKGSKADNSNDMVVRGRAGGSKLTAVKVNEIRSLKKINSDIAANFGISPTAVSNIKKGKSYRFNYIRTTITRKERFLTVVRDLEKSDGITRQKQVIFDAIKQSPGISRTELVKQLSTKLCTKSSVEAIYAYYRHEMLEQKILEETTGVCDKINHTAAGFPGNTPLYNR